MAILTRPKINAQQRLDLEDLNALFASLRTDAKFWTQSVLSGKNQVISGFEVSGLGNTSATVNMAGSALILPENTADFSFFVSPSSATTEEVSASAFVSNTTNYLEAELCYKDGTPLNRAFFDPTANGGEGEEFTQEVNTVVEISLNFSVSTGGFSGDVNKVQIAVIDVNSSGQISSIQDARPLFGSLDSDFAWTSQSGVRTLIQLDGGSGTFIVGEQVNFSNSASAKVVSVGGGSISVSDITSPGVVLGDTMIGQESGAGHSVGPFQESFGGGDKDLTTLESVLKALMTEVRRIKGTELWYQIPNKGLNTLTAFMDSIIIQTATNAKYEWDGSNLSITADASGVDSDVMGKIRQLGNPRELDLTRQDSDSISIPIGERQVLFVKIPESGDRVFSGVGTADENYQVVDAEDFVQTEETFYLAYRENGLLYVRGYGELETGEATPLSDPDKESILALVNSVNPLFNAQDRSLKIVGGGNIQNKDSVLELSADAYIQIPGLVNTRNTIASQSISLAASVDSVAYVNVNRDVGVADNLTVNVSTVDSITPGPETLIIARRTASGIIWADQILLRDREATRTDGATHDLKDVENIGSMVFESLNLIKVKLASHTAADGSSKVLTYKGKKVVEQEYFIDFSTGNIHQGSAVGTIIDTFTPSAGGSADGDYSMYTVSMIQAATGDLDAGLISMRPHVSDRSDFEAGPHQAGAAVLSSVKPFLEGINLGYLVAVRASGDSIGTLTGEENIINVPFFQITDVVNQPKCIDLANSNFDVDILGWTHELATTVGTFSGSTITPGNVSRETVDPLSGKGSLALITTDCATFTGGGADTDFDIVKTPMTLKNSIELGADIIIEFDLHISDIYTQGMSVSRNGVYGVVLELQEVDGTVVGTEVLIDVSYTTGQDGLPQNPINVDENIKVKARFTPLDPAETEYVIVIKAQNSGRLST